MARSERQALPPIAWIAVLLCLPPAVSGIPLPPPPGPIPDFLQQDDAGSGADAPDVFDLALPLATNVFQGVLLTTPRGGLAGVHVNDREDWYEFHARKGQKIGVHVDYVGTVEDTDILGQLVSPDGDVAAQFSAATPEPKWIFASQKGDWRLRVFSEGPGSGYEVRLSVEEAMGFSGGIAGPGYVVMGFDLEPNSQIRGQFSLASIRTRTVPSAATSMVLREIDSDLVVRSSGTTLKVTYMRGAHARVGDAAQSAVVEHATAEAADSYTQGWVPSGLNPDMLIVNGAVNFGRIYLAVFGTAEHRYFNYNLTFVGNVSFVGRTVGGPAEVFARTLQDFEGMGAVHTPAGMVVQNLSTSIDSRRTLLAHFECKAGSGVHACSTTTPSGTRTPVQGISRVIASPEPGPWTFTREQDASVAGHEGVLVHGAFAKLPHDPPTESGAEHDGEDS